MKKDIPKILDWSGRQYRRAREKAIEEGLIKSQKKPKNYYYSATRDLWVVGKQENNNKISTNCSSEEECKALVEYLNEHGWTRENIWIFKEKWVYELHNRNR